MNSLAMAIGAAVLTLQLQGCGPSATAAAPAATYAAHLSMEHRAAADRALAIFRDRCPNLFGRYAGDIESLHLDVLPLTDASGAPLHSQSEDFGWPLKVQLVAKVRSETANLPAGWRAWGHSLYYDMGAGRRPGIDVGKRAAALICALADHGDVFIDEPRLSAALPAR